ncbi:hypothetical protein LCGC14_3127460, partial [marine sediment metagenome]
KNPDAQRILHLPWHGLFVGCVVVRDSVAVAGGVGRRDQAAHAPFDRGNAGAETMSETRHTPLPWIWSECELVHVGADKDGNETIHVVLDDGSAGDEYPQIIDPTGANAKLIVTSVNARPKVEELVRMIKVAQEFRERMQTIPADWSAIEAKAREVEAALGGKAE